jgi:hypothetical protein
MSETPSAPQSEECIDKTPEHRHDAGQPSGEVFEEFGIVDLSESFPMEAYEWSPEFGPNEAHVVVPFRVVVRGLGSRTHARRLADRREREDGGHYKAVLLSDTRGL